MKRTVYNMWYDASFLRQPSHTTETLVGHMQDEPDSYKIEKLLIEVRNELYR